MFTLLKYINYIDVIVLILVGAKQTLFLINYATP